MNRAKKITPFIFILPGLLGFMAFYLVPFFYSLGYAFMDKPVGGSFIGFQNFADLLKNKSYIKGAVNTLRFMLIGIPSCMAVSLIGAVILKDIKSQKMWMLIFLIPLVIPSGSMAFFWRMLFDDNGFLNSLLVKVGINPVSWLNSGAAVTSITIIFIWKNIGYNMVLFLSAMANIPRDYYEYAYVCGAGKLKAFFSITLVYLIPAFFLIFIMSIINSFKIFKEIYMITGSYPHESIYMLQHFMNNMFTSLNYQRLTAATCLMVFAVSALTQGLFAAERRFLR